MLSQYILALSSIISAIINNKHSICITIFMINNPVNFDLDDNTHVIVKKISDNKYDFELLLPNGNRKTFIWMDGISAEFTDKKGRMDLLSNKAVMQFSSLIK